MNAEGREPTIRKILVAIDASPPSLAALRIAAQLARRSNAELIGIFVEDIQLLRLADLPFARQVSLFSNQPRQLDRVQIERQLRAQARQARRALEAVARAAQVRWSFHVVQGVIEMELLSAARESDLIMIGKAGWSHRRRLGSTARLIVTQAPNQLMIVQHGSHLGLPVSVLYDGSDQSRRALSAVANLLLRQEGYLIAIIAADTAETARRLQMEISTWNRGRDMHVHYRWMLNGDVARLVEIIRTERCGVFVLPAELNALHNGDLTTLLDRMDCPVLLVR